MPKSDIKIQK